MTPVFTPEDELCLFSWRARGPGYNSLQMLLRLGETLRALGLVAVLAAGPVAGGLSLASWRGVVRDDAGKPVSPATVKLSAITGDRHYTARTSAGGAFAFPEIVAGDYRLAGESDGKTWDSAKPAALQ